MFWDESESRGEVVNENGHSLRVAALAGRLGRVVHVVASKSSDVLLAFFIISVIGLMILPLPLLLIDILVASNIALGVVLVLMAIYIDSPLRFSAFPSVLLITTLFRLALSVATTRMILLQGDAGNIIDTFGTLVAGGNVVVGLVVFLIITLVQFLVIAKGAERVAEVGARFTLDAMPGKQLSIDSDLRSGLIEKSEARHKRVDLSTESQLHGSLDGAMKFIKGDAIAGVVIIIINLLGGLAIGVFQLDMEAGAAMQKYSILTIGDGLVAQIPALFGATAAGLIVTRVGDGHPGQHLGDAIQNQITAVPRAILLAGVVCLLFAFVPGFPTGVFLVLGFLMFAIGSVLVPTMRGFFTRWSGPAIDTVMRGGERSARPSVERTADVTVRLTRPLLLTLPASVTNDGTDLRLRDELQIALQNHHERTGLLLPPLAFSWQKQDDRSWHLEIFDVPACSGELTSSSDLEDIVTESVNAIRRNARLFFGIEETSRLLAKIGETSPEVVRELDRTLSIRSAAVLMRNLVEEEVPLQNLAAALESIVQASQHEKNIDNLTEYARIALGRQISYRASDGERIAAIGLSLEVEAELLQWVRDNNGSKELCANPELLARITDGLDEAIERLRPRAIVTPILLRRPVRDLIFERHIDLPVLSYQEITKPFRLALVERVEIDLDGFARPVAITGNVA